MEILVDLKSLKTNFSRQTQSSEETENRSFNHLVKTKPTYDEQWVKVSRGVSDNTNFKAENNLSLSNDFCSNRFRILTPRDTDLNEKHNEEIKITSDDVSYNKLIENVSAIQQRKRPAVVIDKYPERQKKFFEDKCE